MTGQAGASTWLFPSMRSLRPSWIRGDVVAGLTVWAVLIPESLAYASIAGVPPVVGLYAAVPALLLYLVFGSSRHLVVGPMSATAALSAGIIVVFAPAGTPQYVALTAGLAIMMGLAGLAAGLLRLGFLASFVSAPVLKGFIVGLALTIIAGQLPSFFGVDKGSGDFFEKIWDLVTQLGNTNLYALGVGVLSLAIVLGLKRWMPLAPGSLIAVAVGIIATQLLDLEAKGVDIVGHIDSGLPQLGLPDVPAGGYLDLAGPAIGVLLVGFAEGLGAAKTYATRHGYEIDANKELLGLGAANLGSGLASGMVVNGSLSKTAVNGGAGARSQLSAVTVAVLTVVTLLFLTGLFESLPEPTLAAVVIAAVVELVDIASLRRLYRVWTHRLGGIYGPAARADFVAAIAALLGVLIFDTLPGLVIGIGVSLVLLLYRSSRPHVAALAKTGTGWVDAARHPAATTAPGVVVVRVEAGLYFANAEHVRQAIGDLAVGGVHAVVLDAQTVPFIDVTAAEMLVELHGRLAAAGIALLITRDIGQVRDVLRHTDGTQPTLYPTVDDAVAAVNRSGRGDER